jgi:phosphonate transport system substrate-binding protein
MGKKLLFKLLTGFIVWSILGATLTWAEKPEVYTVGVVPQFNAPRIHAIWGAILEAVSERSGYRLVLKSSPTIPAFEKRPLAGEFDFAYMNPYHFIKANEQRGYIPLVRDHGSALQGIVVVHKDSPYQSIADLDGKSVTFPAPNALGASLMTRAAFKHEYNINVEQRYVKSHSTVYLYVAVGKTAAGGGVQNTLDEQPPKIRNALRVLYRTQKVSPHPFAVHPRIPKAVREKVRAAMLAVAETPEGRALLARVPTLHIGPASIEDYRSLKALGLDSFYVQE